MRAAPSPTHTHTTTQTTHGLLPACRALVWDSFDFCYRTLRMPVEADRYERRLADSPACQVSTLSARHHRADPHWSPLTARGTVYQADPDGCYGSVVARVILRLRRAGLPAEATAYFSQAVGRLKESGGPFPDEEAGTPLLGWVDEWQVACSCNPCG